MDKDCVDCKGKIFTIQPFTEKKKFAKSYFIYFFICLIFLNYSNEFITSVVV